VLKLGWTELRIERADILPYKVEAFERDGGWNFLEKAVGEAALRSPLSSDTKRLTAIADFGRSYFAWGLLRPGTLAYVVPVSNNGSAFHVNLGSFSWDLQARRFCSVRGVAVFSFDHCPQTLDLVPFPQLQGGGALC